ncbi:hypothetical protein ACQJBY_048222 [Aegilops geniculata]
MIEMQNSEYKAKLCGGSDGELGTAMWQAALQRHEWRAQSTMAGRPIDLRQRGRRARRSTAARPAVLRCFGGKTYCTGAALAVQEAVHTYKYTTTPSTEAPTQLCRFVVLDIGVLPFCRSRGNLAVLPTW